MLSDVFARSHGEVQSDKYRPAAESIILRDEAEIYKPLGQNVRETFPQADVFVRADDRRLLKEDLRRFIRILFGDPFCTPSEAEHSMFHAKAVALRSADLSRQVGAVVCNQAGDILSVGCNEVPKPSGGLYWSGDEPDRRDFVIGYDSSVRMRDDILRELFVRLRENGWLEQARRAKTPDELLTEALTVGDPPLLKSSQITNLLEFGRPVHAEMTAPYECRQARSVSSGWKYVSYNIPLSHMRSTHSRSWDPPLSIYRTIFKEHGVQTVCRLDLDRCLSRTTNTGELFAV